MKPIAGTESCQAAHLGYVLSGRQKAVMDDGSELEWSWGAQVRTVAGRRFHAAEGYRAGVAIKAVRLVDPVLVASAPTLIHLWHMALPALLKDCVLHYIGTVENANQAQGPGWDV